MISKNRRKGQDQTEEAAIFQGGEGIEGASGSLRFNIRLPSIVIHASNKRQYNRS